MSWRKARVEGIEAVDLVVGSHLAAKGAAKKMGHPRRVSCSTLDLEVPPRCAGGTGEAPVAT